MSRSLVMRRMAREELAYRNLLARRRRILVFEWLERQWSFRWTPDAPLRDGLMNLDFDWGGARVVLGIDAACLDRAAAHTLGMHLALETPPDLVAAVAEAALGDVTAAIELSTQRRLRAIRNDADAARNGLHGIPWELGDGESLICGELWVDALALSFLAESWRLNAIEDTNPPADAKAWAELPIPFSFAIGWTDIDAHALVSLQARDVVLLDECWLAEDRLVLLLGRTLSMPCRVNRSTLEITGSLERIMSDTTVSPTEGAFDDELLNELPVRLSFDLGQRELTLAELRELEPGHTFNLGRELRHAVIVHANGRAIGEGELVEIDGRVGVSIIKISGTRT
ncbi:type III secretion system cytoplasmic ring protein SctQ [Variovorax sp. KK3]|uniref:type III secretion system cytoplasmic ring protein SctQ n=1 Tax=Variovorax sp. KK3 TaxID=1855728 RepID=UPI0009F9DA97|nr:type III secretion system cytoplasmic ring protein SctQ [Variovorax sp. KK3]